MERISLNLGWQFAKLPGLTIGQSGNMLPVDEAAFSWETVNLPHTWYRDEDQYRGLTVYKKSVSVGNLTDKALFLEIEAADHTVRAFADEVELGQHKGGYSRVRFAIPAVCGMGGQIELKLYVDNSITPDVSPLSGDFTVFGGLTRGISLLVAEAVHFDYLYYGTDGVIVRAGVDENGNGILELEPHVDCGGSQGDISVQYKVRDPEGNIVADCEGSAEAIQELIIPSVRLWNGRKNPALYMVEARILMNGGCVDSTEISTGFRRIAMDSDRGFFLNGRHVRINGVAKHQDFAEKFSAVTNEEIDKDFMLIKEISANAIRLSHYQHPQYTYDCCDRNGYITWAEIPMLKMTEDVALQENTKQQLTELILQNIHHPSVCFWGVQNEIAMFRDAPFIHDNIRELYVLAKNLDPSRIVSCANLYPLKAKSRLNHLTDIVGYNIYFGWYYGKMEDYDDYLDGLHKQLPAVPLGISEYGVDTAPWFHSENPMVKDYSEEFQALFHETVYPIIRSKEYLWGSFIWNMFDFSSSRRDEGGQKFINAKGLVTYDRQIKKDAFYYYKAVWSDQPMLHICAKRFVKRCRESLDIKVYTNLEKAVLTSDVLRLTASNNGNGTIVFPNVSLKEGTNIFRVSASTADGRILEDTVVFERVSEPEESYRLPDSKAGTTVKNWFLDEADIDTDQYYSIKDRADELLDNKEAHQVLRQYMPDTTILLEKGVIPLGLAMTSILSHDKDIEGKVDIQAMNKALMKIAKC